jgi:hypothetical protein
MTPMLNHTDKMRAMAETYLQLARISDDATKCRKFLDYAAMYADLAEHSVRREDLREGMVFTPKTSALDGR